MTNERTYYYCCEALKAAAIAENYAPDTYINLFEKYPEAAASLSPLLAALVPIMQDARAGMDKANSSGAVLSALKRITKASGREDLRGGWIDQQGRYCVCSGFHAVRLPGAKFDSIPAVPAVDSLDRIMTRPDGLHQFTPPTVADCKAWKAAHKGEPMPIDEGRRYVDAGYMLDVLQALPGAVFLASNSAVAPIWADAPTGDGILMPKRPPKAA